MFFCIGKNNLTQSVYNKYTILDKEADQKEKQIYSDVLYSTQKH